MGSAIAAVVLALVGLRLWTGRGGVRLSGWRWWAASVPSLGLVVAMVLMAVGFAMPEVRKWRPIYDEATRQWSPHWEYQAWPAFAIGCGVAVIALVTLAVIARQRALSAASRTVVDVALVGLLLVGSVFVLRLLRSDVHLATGGELATAGFAVAVLSIAVATLLEAALFQLERRRGT